MKTDNIVIKDLSLSFGEQALFEGFSSDIFYGERIFIIGDNGSGKSTLLKAIKGVYKDYTGNIHVPEYTIIEYIPQILRLKENLSGGQSFNKELSRALSQNPDILLLDEPTNHLDQSNKRSLMNMLERYYCTLIIVSHDVKLLSKLSTKIWNIKDTKIDVFNGTYDEYLKKIDAEFTASQGELTHQVKEQKKLKKSIMQEQERKQKSSTKGKKKHGNDKISAGYNKNNAEVSSGKKNSFLKDQDSELSKRIDELRVKESPKVKFSITSGDIRKKNPVNIIDGSCGYKENILIKNISFSVYSNEKVLIAGNNASGKSTLIKAIMDLPEIIRQGNWDCINIADIGYLDQTYSNLNPDKSILETIDEIFQNNHQSRAFLNGFLFSKNHQVSKKISVLSGGEKARLSMALIAAKTPRMLILDEITNNLDIATKEYIINVLKDYPGAIIMICHDEHFVEQFQIDTTYEVIDGSINLR